MSSVSLSRDIHPLKLVAVSKAKNVYTSRTRYTLHTDVICYSLSYSWDLICRIMQIVIDIFEWRLRIRINASAASCPIGRLSNRISRRLQMQMQMQMQMQTPRGIDALLSCMHTLTVVIMIKTINRPYSNLIDVLDRKMTQFDLPCSLLAFEILALTPP